MNVQNPHREMHFKVIYLDLTHRIIQSSSSIMVSRLIIELILQKYHVVKTVLMMEDITN